MTAISVREMTPIVGKTEALKSRLNRAASVMSRHGANSWVTQVMAGDGAGDFHLYATYANYSDAAKAFTAFSSDPDMIKIQKERETDQAGHMRGPLIGRLVYGSPAIGTDMPVSVHRDFHMPRANMSKVLDIMPSFEESLKPMGVEIAVGTMLIGEDHEMTRSIYRFSSLQHWGESIDKMLVDKKLQSLFAQAGEIGTLKKSRMMVRI